MAETSSGGANYQDLLLKYYKKMLELRLFELKYKNCTATRGFQDSSICM